MSLGGNGSSQGPENSQSLSRQTLLEQEEYGITRSFPREQEMAINPSTNFLGSLVHYLTRKKDRFERTLQHSNESERKNGTSETESYISFLREACIIMFANNQAFVRLIKKVEIRRESFLNERDYELTVLYTRQLTEIILELFVTMDNAKMAFDMFKEGQAERIVFLDDLYDNPEPDQAIEIDLGREIESANAYIEKLNPFEITPNFVREAADHHRLIFGNTMHFVKCLDCGKRQTAKEIFGYLKKDDLVPLEIMDNFSGSLQCPCCPGRMERIHDPQMTYELFYEKLCGDGTTRSFVSVLRRANGSIGGMAFAYLTTAERERELEWGNSGDPYMFECKPEANSEKIKEKFLSCLRNEIFPDQSSINGGRMMIAWNHISVSPDMTGSMLELTYDLFTQIPPVMHNMLVLGDVKRGSVAHRFFRKLGGRDGTSFFGEESDNILIGGKVIDALKYLKTIHD